MIKITEKGFRAMIKEIEELKAQIEKLRNANNFLNDEIKEYKEFQDFITGKK